MVADAPNVVACPRCGYPNAPGARTCAGCAVAIPGPPGAATYAGFGRRVVAALIDVVVLALLLVAAAVPAFLLVQDEDLALIVWLLLWLLAMWLYFARLESGPRQATLGKRALGLRVADLDRNRVSFARATARHFGMYVTWLTPFEIGYLMSIWTKRKQTLHDYMASTVVLKAR